MDAAKCIGYIWALALYGSAEEVLQDKLGVNITATSRSAPSRQVSWIRRWYESILTRSGLVISSARTEAVSLAADEAFAYQWNLFLLFVWSSKIFMLEAWSAENETHDLLSAVMFIAINKLEQSIQAAETHLCKATVEHWPPETSCAMQISVKAAFSFPKPTCPGNAPPPFFTTRRGPLLA
jgi:hypothetical protein